ncbi:site-specific integrase [Microvirga flavescens]|uniref:site-specific integrase n=1 Tax=Microvirga flavescens TaxID=2249811 RepID=UPI000DDB3EDB|nr:site-specific integrase [Microvirga flavescens]
MDQIIAATEPSGLRETLPIAVREFTEAAISANTRRAYRADLDHFLLWGGSVPSSAETIARYLSVHAERLSIATLARRLVSISKAHTSRGFPNPVTSDLVHLTMRGIRRVHGKPQRQSAALLVQDVRRMIAGFGDNPTDLRDRALILIGFAGALRRSELRAINCSDIARVPHGLLIQITRSKTDQEGNGRKIGIPYGRTVACPVLALEAWLARAQIGEGPIFRPIDRQGVIAETALSGEAVAHIIKRRAKAAGLDPTRYSGHSLRAGLATSAAEAGVPTWKIKAQTGHRSDAVLSRYIRDGEMFIQNAASVL